jgi:hypothetical protein
MLTIRASQMAALEDAARSNFKQRLDEMLQPLSDQPPDLDGLIEDAAEFQLQSEADVTRFASAVVSQGLTSSDGLSKPAQNALLAHGVASNERLSRMETALGVSTGSVAGFSSSEIGAVVQPCSAPPRPVKTDHWVEIELIGEDDSPIAWEEYRVTLPDGVNVKGYVDSEGLARVENIEQPGNCSIAFPRLDRRTWDWATQTGGEGQAI